MKKEQIAEFEDWMSGKYSEAVKNLGKLVKMRAGWYLVAIKSNIPGKPPQVLGLEQLGEDYSRDKNWWMAREWNGYWRTDPYRTLWQLKESLNLE